MQKKLHFFIIDDDEISVEIYKKLLEDAGHKVSFVTSSEDALAKITDLKPDCVLCDLLLPGKDGFDLFQEIRKLDIPQPTFIIITGKTYEFDRRRALSLGIDGYLMKPIDREHFVDKLLEIINSSMVVQFWGVRGTFPVPGDRSIRYGGNTNCVTICCPDKYFLIFDAGTGIKELSNFLIQTNKFPISAKIFLTHPHYDHINGIPFFAPLYMKGNDFEIIGADQSGVSLEEVVAGQMDNVYFPITMNEFSSKIKFRAINEETFNIGELKVQSMLLNHPGRCLGYKIEYKNKIFCYVTDNEIFPEDSPYHNAFEFDRLVNFLANADLAIVDTTYLDKDYPSKIGWGHSSIGRVVELIHKAKVKVFCLHHHDPDDSDDKIDQKLKDAKTLLKSLGSKTRVIAPHEGDKIIL